MSPILKFVAYAGRIWDGRVIGSSVDCEDGCLEWASHDHSGGYEGHTYSVDGHLYDDKIELPDRGEGTDD